MAKKGKKPVQRVRSKLEIIAQEASSSVTDALCRTSDHGEAAALQAFVDEFDTLLEGWKMRLDELREEEEEGED
jgi:hypothetical protein